MGLEVAVALAPAVFAAAPVPASVEAVCLVGAAALVLRADGLAPVVKEGAPARLLEPAAVRLGLLSLSISEFNLLMLALI